MIFDDQWFEIWYCPGRDIAPHYILVLATSVSKPTRYLVYDPQLNYRIIYEANDYESAVQRLRKMSMSSSKVGSSLTMDTR
jgi:hypothetical protein